MQTFSPQDYGGFGFYSRREKLGEQMETQKAMVERLTAMSDDDKTKEFQSMYRRFGVKVIYYGRYGNYDFDGHNIRWIVRYPTKRRKCGYVDTGPMKPKGIVSLYYRYCDFEHFWSTEALEELTTEIFAEL